MRRAAGICGLSDASPGSPCAALRHFGGPNSTRGLDRWLWLTRAWGVPAAAPSSLCVRPCARSFSCPLNVRVFVRSLHLVVMSFDMFHIAHKHFTNKMTHWHKPC